MNRRDFIFLGATFAAGCGSLPPGAGIAPAPETRAVNAGPAGQFLADGIYAQFRDEGFFIVRRGANLFAISAVCTHRKCKLDAEADNTFYCPCHGSTFDADGNVTAGPARRRLPVFTVSTDDKGDLRVNLSAS